MTVLHLLGVALLVGAVAALDLRLLARGGPAPALPVGPLAAHLLPLAWGGFALSAATGAALFATAATAYAGNAAFLAKMAALALAGVNALALSRAGGVAGAASGRLRAAAVASLALWVAALALGRWIAYR